MISHTTQRFRKEFKDLSKSVQRQKPKPLGQPTRGKTAPNRLRKTDTFLGVAFPDFVRRMTGLYVDLGYGAYPVTSVETLRRLRRLNPSLRALGVEIDPQRVAEAQPFAEPRLEFHLGGFNLPLQPDESVSVLRAFNVLRQYDEAAVAKALAALSAPLIEGGLILEGTSDPLGRLLTFNLFQKQKGDLERIAFVLAPPCAPTLRQAQGKLFSRAGFRRCCPRTLSITPSRAARLIVSSPRGSGRARAAETSAGFSRKAPCASPTITAIALPVAAITLIAAHLCSAAASCGWGRSGLRQGRLEIKQNRASPC